MSALVVDCTNHRTGGSGQEGGGGSIVVEAYESTVYLNLRDEDGKEPDVTRMLDPDEARALAAALLHFAAEMER